MLSLYQLNCEYTEALESLEIDENGEILNADALDSIQGQLEEKAENVAVYVKSLDAEEKALKDEQDKIAARRKSIARKSEYLRRQLAAALDRMGIEKFKRTRCVLSFRKGESVRITDDTLLPSEYIRIKTEPDKTAIKQAIKDGKEVPGAEIEETRSVQVR